MNFRKMTVAAAAAISALGSAHAETWSTGGTASPYWMHPSQSTSKVSVGGNYTPLYQLQIFKNAGEASSAITSYGNRGVLYFEKTNGTQGAQTDVVDGNQIGVIQANARSTSLQGTAAISFRVDGAVTTGQRPGAKLEFYTNKPNGGQTVNMVLRGDGKVGIGTTGPGAKLDVQDASNNLTKIFNTNLNYGTGVGGTYTANNLTAAYGTSSTGALTGLKVNVSNAGTGGTYAAAFMGGFVGIGNATPSSALHIRRDEGVASGEHGWFSIDRNGLNSLPADPAFGIGYRADGTNPTRVWIGSGNAQPLDFRTTATGQAMSILNNGNVGVAQPNPQAKLDVGGSILSRGYTPPATGSGSGVEIDYGGIAAGTGRIFAYDRNASVYKPFRVGNGLDIAANGDMTGLGSMNVTGNLGVGVPVPTQKLDVEGNVGVRGSVVLTGWKNFIGNSYGGSYNDFWRIYMDQPTNDGGILHIRTGDNRDEPIWFEQSVNDNPDVAATVRMAISSSGFVGIGTTAPDAELHVYGGSVGGGTSGIDITNPVSYNQPNGGHTFKLSSGIKGVTEGGFTIMDRTVGDVSRIAIDNNGNVGVGTSTPGAKLDVSGDVKVSGNISVASVNTKVWSIAPDYVFEKGYDLKPLAHVDRYVKEHKHLPEIPSAKEISEKGIDLAEMNMKLLRKVEELTLYSIKQEKKIDDLTFRLEKVERKR